MKKTLQEKSRFSKQMHRPNRNNVPLLEAEEGVEWTEVLMVWNDVHVGTGLFRLQTLLSIINNVCCSMDIRGICCYGMQIAKLDWN